MSQHFEIQSSRYLAAMLCVVHGAVLAVLPLLALPPWAKLPLAAIILSSLAYYLRRDALLLAADSCIGVVFEADAVTLRLRNGTRLHGVLAADTLVTPLLTVLRIKTSGWHASRSIVVLPDRMNPESFRQLRVGLKWNGFSSRGSRAGPAR